MNVGTVEQKYKIRSPLRCDGVGSLDCAEDIESGARMAIRWLPLDANGEAAAKTVEKLPNHPMLPKIRSTGHVGSAAYVAMDFPEGRLLSAVLEEPMSASVVRRLGAELADALATVHGQGAFHGELSADSILVLPEGKAILWDMPLVIANRLTDRRGEERFMRQLLHMSAFLSPERARGSAASNAGDVYSLAAVLCFAGGSRMLADLPTLEVVHRIATGQWTPDVPMGLSEDMRRLVKRMLAPEALDRPAAKEVAEKLFALPPLRPSEVLGNSGPKPIPPPLPAPAQAKPAADAETPPAPVVEAKPAPAPVPEPTPEPVVETKPEPVTETKEAPQHERAPITERELPAIVPPRSAVVAPNIEVATDQINPEDVDFDPEIFRQRTPWLLVGVFASVFVIAGIVVAWNFPWAPPAPVQPPSPPVAVAPPVPEADAADDAPPADPEAARLLVPLIAKKHAPPAPSPKARKAPAAKSAKPAAPTAASQAPNGEGDFDFLSKDAEAPKSELKRPSF